MKTDTQTKGILAWVNQTLASLSWARGQVDKISDLTDSVALITICEHLAHRKAGALLRRGGGKYWATATTTIQRVDNATVLADLLCGMNLRSPPSPQEIVDGNEKLLLGLVWALIRYSGPGSPPMPARMVEQAVVVVAAAAPPAAALPEAEEAAAADDGQPRPRISMDTPPPSVQSSDGSPRSRCVR
eukprot:m51a1_g12571 hypothetical protein (187) ;mRNA; f:2195-4242